jgi:glutathione synthase/RimK-type ligase-like ATP-grasp enzyme
MEILRNILFKNNKDMITYKFGGYSDFINFQQQLNYPVIVKKSSGSASKGVYLSKSKEALKKLIKKISNTNDYRSQIIDFLFAQKKRINNIQYINRVTLFRKKFIIQNFIEGIPNDYKVLIFDNKYYVLKRFNRNDDFRASGSGKFVKSVEFEVPGELLNSCNNWFKTFDVPCASFDVAFKDNKYYLIEFQFVSFGTYTQTSAKRFYIDNHNQWEISEKLIPLEEVYADSIIKYLRRKSLTNA